MTDKEMDAKKLLKQAIRSEIDGYRFYSYLARKASNEDAGRKLANLARDEKRHEAVLKRIYKQIYKEEAADIPEKGVGALAAFFDNPEAREGMSEVQYIDLAMEAELAATNYYKQGAKDAPDDDIRKIYEGMAAEEFNHYELLQAEKAAIGGGYYWFGLGDGAPLED